VVTDLASGKVVASATITDDQGTILGTTDAQGAFSLVVEPNEYFLSATAEGFFTSQPATFTIDANQTQDVALKVPAKGANIAMTGKASASSESLDNPAALVNDGDLTTFWLGNDDETTADGQWVAVTWDKPTHFTAVQLRGFQRNIQASSLQYLDTDGKTWKELPNASFTPQFLGKRLPWVRQPTPRPVWPSCRCTTSRCADEEGIVVE
jgi:hypothetical protein